MPDAGKARTSALSARRVGLSILVAALAVGSPAAIQAQDASPSAQAEGRIGVGGATEPAYLETFDQAPAWLEVEQVESGETAVQEGMVFMSIKGEAVHYQDWYELEAAVPSIRVEANVDIDSTVGTAGGVSCGSALGLPRWFVAGVNNGDTWFLGRIIDGRLQVIDQGDLPAGVSAASQMVRVAIDCVMAPEDGGDYVRVSVGGQQVSADAGRGRLDIPIGAYDKAALFVGTDEGTGSALYDDLAVLVGAG